MTNYGKFLILLMVLCILIAHYGLCQSAYKFYMLIKSLLLDIGMIHCQVDHGIFMGEWESALDSLITMPSNRSSLVSYVLLHVDNGLAVTNSPSLYTWLLLSLSAHLQIMDLGPCKTLEYPYPS